MFDNHIILDREKEMTANISHQIKLSQLVAAGNLKKQQHFEFNK